MNISQGEITCQVTCWLCLSADSHHLGALESSAVCCHLPDLPRSWFHHTEGLMGWRETLTADHLEPLTEKWVQSREAPSLSSAKREFNVSLDDSAVFKWMNLETLVCDFFTKSSSNPVHSFQGEVKAGLWYKSITFPLFPHFNKHIISSKFGTTGMNVKYEISETQTFFFLFLFFSIVLL